MAAGPNYNLIGAGSFSGGAFTAPLIGANGSAAAPTYSFTNSPTYGWYYDSTNTSLAASLGGTELVQISNNSGMGQIHIGNSNAASVSQLTMGIKGSASAVGLALTPFNGEPCVLVYKADASGYAGLLCSRLYSQTPGSAAAPSIILANTLTMGMYSPGTNQLGLATNGQAALTINASQQTSSIKWLNANKTTNYTVLAADSSTVFDNTGAAGGVTFTLPAASPGLTYTFGSAVAQIITVAPQAADAIGAKAANTAYACAAAKGNCLTVTCTAANYWLITSNVGFA